MTQVSVELPSGLATTVISDGSGPEIVYLHSAIGISASDPILHILTQRFKVVAPLGPGFDDPDELLTIANVHDLALHYDDLFSALELSGATVVGHSFGAMVAAELAAHFPERVSKLMLICPYGLWDDEDPVLDLFAVPFLEWNDYLWGDPEGPPAQAARAAVLTLNDAEQAVVMEALIPLAKGLTAAANFMWPIPDKGLSRRLRRVRADTVIVWGTRDDVVPASYAERFAGLIPRSTVAMVDGAGHMLPFEAPEQLMTLLADLVER